MPSKKQVTIKDVAQEAGVSPATVSRVLSQDDYIIEETKQLVMEAVEKTGYKITSKKKNPYGKKMNNILVLCSGIRDIAANYYLDGIERKANESGYTIYIKNLTENILVSGELSADLIEEWCGKCNASGIIIYSDALDDEFLKEVADRIPTVLLLSETNIDNAFSIDLNEEELMRKLFMHFIAAGKKKIAIMVGREGHKRNTVLKEIYFKMVKEFGLEYDPLWCLVNGSNLFSTSAAAVAEALLVSDNPPDVFISASDIYAAGIVYACHKLGRKIPEDVAVVGRDNTSICHVMTPSLTAFDVPMAMIGYNACSSAIAMIADRNLAGKKLLIDADLVLRGST